MAFTEFCCRSGGSNLNAGTRTGNSTEPGTAAFKTYTSGTWVQATRTFTPAGGANPTTDGIAVGDFVSIYPDAATVTPYVARIATVGATTFVTDATAKAGTAPVDGALVTSASIGGAWKGPNAAEGFPFNFVGAALTNSSTLRPRINLKNDAQYNITAAISNAIAGPCKVQGYTASYGDGGKATIDGGTSGASYTLYTTNNVAQWELEALIFANNGATGSADGVISGVSGGGLNNVIRNCVFCNMRGSGLTITASFHSLVENEAYSNGLNNTASKAGIDCQSSNCQLIRNVSHDNTGSNTAGIRTNGGNILFNIVDTNGGDGIVFIASTVGYLAYGNECYNNGGDGLDITINGAAAIYAENNNFIKNAGYGINAVGNGTIIGFLINNGFGSGTAANTSGTTNLTTGTDMIEEIGSVTYGANLLPWVDAPNGDFRINLAAAKGAGRGAYTETAASYTGTIGYPDIGAAQHLESGGGGGGGSVFGAVGGVIS